MIASGFYFDHHGDPNIKWPDGTWSVSVQFPEGYRWMKCEDKIARVIDAFATEKKWTLKGPVPPLPIPD